MVLVRTGKQNEKPQPASATAVPATTRSVVAPSAKRPTNCITRPTGASARAYPRRPSGTDARMPTTMPTLAAATTRPASLLGAPRRVVTSAGAIVRIISSTALVETTPTSTHAIHGCVRTYATTLCTSFAAPSSRGARPPMPRDHRYAIATIGPIRDHATGDREEQHRREGREVEDADRERRTGAVVHEHRRGHVLQPRTDVRHESAGPVHGER